MKESNPKSAFGDVKIPLHLWPATATILGSLGLLDGALKYGRGNWKAVGVRASTYYDACSRHLNKWFEGEEADPDSGLPHLAHALACMAIVVDAGAAGMLEDDRNYKGGYVDMIGRLTPHVARLKALHAAKNPRHYTINDITKEDKCEEPECRERVRTAAALFRRAALNKHRNNLREHNADVAVSVAERSTGLAPTRIGSADPAGCTATLVRSGSQQAMSEEPAATNVPKFTILPRQITDDGTCATGDAQPAESQGFPEDNSVSYVTRPIANGMGPSGPNESRKEGAPGAVGQSRSSWLYRERSERL